jgi:gliding motility-associated-like protein
MAIRRVFFILAVFFCQNLAGFSQGCNCPTSSNCGTCVGGYTSLTLLFNGGSPSTIQASDQLGVVFNGIVNPGGVFTFTGSIPTDKFVGPAITILVNGLPNATISTFCAGGTFVGSSYGAFTVVSGQSLNGGALCCAPASIETTPPVISGCPTNMVQPLTSSCSVAVFWAAPSATDNCTLASFSSTKNSGDAFMLGTTSVTYTAVDSYGNSSTCSFNVTVIDSTVPIFSSCPTNLILSANASCEAVANWTPPMASDNCAISSTAATHAPGSIFPIGTTTVLYSATDATGNTGTCSFTVQVTDNSPPAFGSCPTNITVSSSPTCSTAVTWSVPVATDNCGTPSVSSTHNPGDLFTQGTTTVTYTALDGGGHTTLCSFTVTVNDVTPPSFTSCPGDISVAASASCEAIATWTLPTATDNCAVTNVIGTHLSGTLFPIGTTVVSYQATDGSGNSTTCSFNVLVVDNTPPVFTNCPSNIRVQADAYCQAVVNWTPPIVSDICGISSNTSNFISGATFGIGTTTVIYSASDTQGNTATCQFTIVVEDDQLPEVSNCPADIRLASDESETALVTWQEPLFTIACGSLVIERSHAPGTRFSVGSTQVSYVATDGLGKTASCTFNVTIERTEISIEISKLLTPDGDGYHDFWEIVNIDRYPSNSIIVFDRWGSVIYEATGYNNQSVRWNGLTKNNSRVPTGTYFYSIDIEAGSQKVKREGFIEVLP